MRKMVLIPFEKFESSDLNSQNQEAKSNSITINSSSCFWKNTPVNKLSIKANEKELNNDSDADIVTVQPNNKPSQHTHKDTDKLSEDIILYPFVKRQRRIAEALLQYIKKHLSWNKNGEIICHGHVVQGSHVTDLIKDALAVNKKQPAHGYQQFYSCLKGVPLSLIVNKDRKPLVGKGTVDVSSKPTNLKRSMPPPPGYPVSKKPREINEFDFLSQWKSK